MHCHEVKNRVDRYLRGELPPDAASEVEQHLQACPDCRSALEGARELENVFRRSETPPVPEGFAAEVRDRADTVMGPLPAWRSLSRPWRAAVAAGLLLGLALGFAMGSAGPGGQDEPARTPGLEYLSEGPRGSINRAYVSMVSDRRKGE